jgi:folate-dependent phosphoribosylglycinamide formyltransferase PurN
MRVAAFMSGSGTNIIKLIESEKSLTSEKGSSPFHVIFIFSDKSDGSCQGEKIAYENSLPYFTHDIRAFHRVRGLQRSVNTAFEIDVIALGGYMSYITLDRCVNVHPADLSILAPDGKRQYVGDHAVLDAIADGETTLCSSTLWTDQGVDTGPLMMISDPLKIELPEPLESLLKDRKRLLRLVQDHQKRLKEVGDWKIFPRTIEMIAQGRFALDEMNRVYVDGNPVPEGYREEEESFKS